jgi:hypothetical protein
MKHISIGGLDVSRIHPSGSLIAAGTSSGCLLYAAAIVGLPTPMATNAERDDKRDAPGDGKQGQSVAVRVSWVISRVERDRGLS